jgi:type VI secretion system secreted protein Hcp
MKRSILLLGAILLFVLPARAVDMFLKLTDISGESTNAKHKDEIEIISYSLGLNNTNAVISGAANRPVFSDITLAKRVDKSTPLLMLNCAKGQHVTQAILTLARSGIDASNFMVITLDDVIITNISSSGAAGSDVPFETVSLNYGKIKLDYYQQKPDGSIILAGTFAYDLITNKTL